MRRLPANVQAALDKLEPIFRKAFADAISDIKDAAKLGVIIDHISAGRITLAVEALRIEKPFFDPLASAVAEAFTAGGRDAIINGPRAPDPSTGRGGFKFAFDSRRPSAEEAVRRIAGDLITSIVEDQKLKVRDVILKGVREGAAPKDIALNIIGRINPLTKRREGGLIGLNDLQQEHLLNATRELNTLSKGYFTRKLRDKRYDNIVLKAIKDKKPLSKSVKETILGRYGDRLLRWRGEVVARTEAITAFRAGSLEAQRQLVATGSVDDSQIEKIWQATIDGRERTSHREMNGQRVQGVDTPFTFPDGSTAMFPGDTSLNAPAKETILCRCFVRYRINYIPARRAA